MRVVRLSTIDIGGGAARGSYALHRELLRQGVDSILVVEQKTSTDPTVIGDVGHGRRLLNKVRHRLDRVPLRIYPEREGGYFSLSAVPGSVVRRVRALAPDLVHLHWVGASFVRPEDLRRFGVPVVWTLRDMWAFTGGCHYSMGCRRFEQSCGFCPQLGSKYERDLSRWLWSRKRHNWDGIALFPVGISGWIGEQAQASSLFRGCDVTVINNAIDVEFWRPMPRKFARKTLSLPEDRKVLLFIALNVQDPRKGFSYFVDACRVLARGELGDRLHAVVVGASAADVRTDLGIPTQFVGSLTDDELIRDAYAAADVTVVPSLEEAFGKTAAESLACGTPVVCFDATGLADVVDHQLTGYRAIPFESGDLANGVRWVLRSEDRWRALSQAAHNVAKERFSLKLRGRDYIDLYESVLEKA